MTPFTVNVMLQSRVPLPIGHRIPFTPAFRHSGTVHTIAVVWPSGIRT